MFALFQQEFVQNGFYVIQYLNKLAGSYDRIDGTRSYYYLINRMEKR